MIKQHNNTVIKIWSKEAVNHLEGLPKEDKPFEIEQIEYAYDDQFIVEIRRKKE